MGVNPQVQPRRLTWFLFPLLRKVPSGDFFLRKRGSDPNTATAHMLVNQRGELTALRTVRHRSGRRWAAEGRSAARHRLRDSLRRRTATRFKAEARRVYITAAQPADERRAAPHMTFNRKPWLKKNNNNESVNINNFTATYVNPRVRRCVLILLGGLFGCKQTTSF